MHKHKRVHTHPGTCITARPCLRPPPLRRTANANRGAGPRRAHADEHTAWRPRCAARRTTRCSGWISWSRCSAIISPTADPSCIDRCAALPGLAVGTFDGCPCRAFTRLAAQEQENAEFEASAKGRGLFGSTLFADDEDDGRGRAIEIVDSHKSCACACRMHCLSRTVSAHRSLRLDRKSFCVTCFAATALSRCRI